jgi:hypothetical protein
MLFTTTQPITHSMALAITRAIHEVDPDATVRAEMSSQQIVIDGNLSADAALAALDKAHCMSPVFVPVDEAVHVQGGHTCCGHCA